MDAHEQYRVSYLVCSQGTPVAALIGYEMFKRLQPQIDDLVDAGQCPPDPEWERMRSQLVEAEAVASC